MNIVEEKKALRKVIKERKRNLSQEDKERQAKEVYNTLEVLPEFLNARTVLAYWALPDELPTEHFVNEWYLKKRILLPVVVGEDLELHEYSGPSCLQPQPPFGILEPRGTQLVAPNEVDCVIVPGVAFDDAGHRLGRGRGYYDRLFPKMPDALRIGVCLGEQMVENVPCEVHDCTMHRVLSGRI